MWFVCVCVCVLVCVCVCVCICLFTCAFARACRFPIPLKQQHMRKGEGANSIDEERASSRPAALRLAERPAARPRPWLTTVAMLGQLKTALGTSS